ncbi:hypothetical protein [Cellulophaga sp. L1A9]|uniref:hypothetical protein n=1 Tax=Cellulophaga sp. L1A9 TaxID=2686362 RepID=UPI00131CFEBE|nr:hypothetical protein [Cellulophaga sp. L1A9]
MKKISKRKILILIALGMFAIAASQVFSHYISLSDLVQGLCTGTGIGLLLTALVFGNLKTEH